MKLTTELLRDAALYVNDYYKNHFNGRYSFHNYERTVNIVRNCDALAVRMHLDNQEVKINHLAAWFLELGYANNADRYQETSAELARDYLQKQGVDEEIIRQVQDSILSTRVPQQPVSVSAQILCDASMYHLGGKGAYQVMEAMRAEDTAVKGQEYSDEEWFAENEKMISDHFYFTAAARDLFQKRKEKLLAQIRKKRKQEQDTKNNPPSDNETQVEKAGDEDGFKLERGVETFFRITERRHMELSKNAHDKASLLISVNSIVLSIVLSVLFTKLEDNTYLLLPTLLLVITCTTTIIFAILSTRPRLIDNNSKMKPLEDHEINILFFGDFSKLSISEYKKEMKATYKNRADLYDSITKDIYYQGIILVWKYKYIKISYNIFMYGFIVTILSFIIAFGIHTSK
jgi:predicted metal-dependent HD superfamily phosphohydrolase